jgi:hypothetical protein
MAAEGLRAVKITTPLVPRLRDWNISKKESELWQLLARVPDNVFEAALADTTRMPTIKGIIRAGPTCRA